MRTDRCAFYTVVGNICETDTLACDRQINEIKEGDFLVFYNAGAYGFEMSSNFNSRLKPAEVLVKDGKATLIRKRDSFDYLLQTRSSKNSKPKCGFPTFRFARLSESFCCKRTRPQGYFT